MPSEVPIVIEREPAVATGLEIGVAE